MADNRYNKARGFHGQSPMGPGMPNMTTVRGTYVQPNVPMNPMIQQQMMMRFPMQNMRMGPPNTPPPPYSAHQQPGMAMLNQPRTTLSKSKGTHQKSEKERFFEEQRQKLRQFGKPGAKKVDTDSLIGSMFKVDAKPAVQKSKGKASEADSKAEDDGFGEFLQGPASDPSAAPDRLENSNTLTDAFEENGEPTTLPIEEKKDLTSMMLECSDLSAPQKAKGFHKPTLNEVHRPKHHDNQRRSSYHESDHSISWKSAKDLDGLFQLPAHTVAAPVPTQQPFPMQQVPPGQGASAMVNNAFLVQGQALPTSHAVDNVTLATATPHNFAAGPLPHHPLGPPPTGPPPTYGEATSSSEALTHPGVTQTPPLPQGTPPNNMFAPPSSNGPVSLPEWCSFNENQVPPVYKQILEASLVDGKIATDRLYPILLLSGLPREKLAHLWSLCNTGTPGLLVKTELWLILALVALTQNNHDTSRVDILVRCPVPPIPSFTTGQNATPSPLSNTNPSQPHSHHHPVLPTGGDQPVNHSGSAILTHNLTTTATLQSEPQQPPSIMHPPAPSITPPQLMSKAPTAGVMATCEAAVEDDFADFQTAPTESQAVGPSGFNSKDMQQEDSFGEFIGGGGGGNGSGGSSDFVSGVSSFDVVESDPLDFPPYLPPRHCGELEPRPISIGNGHLPSCSSHRVNSQKSHTSPSFEDDDFTDGRDSFSQVSTSEQSEIDDIHNFEHYVEEFNHNKREAPDGSPLHCPFPSVHQNNTQIKPGPGHRDLTQQSPTGDKNLKGMESPTKLKSVQIPPPLKSLTQNTFSMTMSSSSNAAPVDHIVNDEDGDFGDFADFKSASSSSTSTTTTAVAAASASHSQCSDDKYGALRDLTQEMDLMQSSVFDETETHRQPGSENDASNSQEVEEDEEWANFSEAPPTPCFGSGEVEEAGNQNDNHFHSTPDTLSSNSGIIGPQQEQTSNTKEGIIKLFQTGSTLTPTPLDEDTGIMVNSDSGYSTRSWGNNKSGDPTLTPTSMFDLSTISPSGSDIKVIDDNKQQRDNDKSFFNHSQITDSGIEANWVGYGVQGSNATSLGQSSSMPTFSMVKSKKEDEEDWGDFSNTALTTTSSANASMATVFSGINHSDSSKESSAFHQSFDSNLGITNPMPVTTMDFADLSQNEGDDWANFSAATSLQSDDAGISSDAITDSNGTNFVTIKKQNLGTSEIMGLFKVRDDPATMSGYQLPPNTQSSPSSSTVVGGAGKLSTGHSRKSSRRSNGRQVSSDFDDDMMPPPMDYDEDGDDDHAFSRGYDLDDLMHQQPPTTSYSLFGSTTSSPMYSRALGKSAVKLKDSKEDSGSVNSLELPSTSQTFDGSSGVGGGGSDNHSMSSMDMAAGNSGGMASAESKSLDSLDFKTTESPTEFTDEAGKEGVQQQQQHQQHLPPPSNPHPIQPQELLASMPKLADKYNIDDVAQGNDRYSYEWQRCLEQCSQVFKEANTIFNNISSSAICNEVLKSMQGWEYVSCVIEIYRVACRVMTAMRSTAISSSELEQTLKEIDLLWNNLSAFLVGASLLPEPSSLVFTSAILKSDQDSSSSSSSVKTSSACGVCLLNVDVPTTSTTSTTSSSLLSSLASSSSIFSTPSACIESAITIGINSKLSFAGCNYHSTCANFWVNCVDQTLPSLVLPELI